MVRSGEFYVIKETKMKHSRFGIASVCITLFNISIIIYFIYLFSQWLMVNPEYLKSPSAINGIHIPESTMFKIYFLLIMTLLGFTVGIFGFIEKNRRRVMPIIGIFSNGFLLIVLVLKLT